MQNPNPQRQTQKENETKTYQGTEAREIEKEEEKHRKNLLRVGKTIFDNEGQRNSHRDRETQRQERNYIQIRKGHECVCVCVGGGGRLPVAN